LAFFFKCSMLWRLDSLIMSLFLRLATKGLIS
jgi:hypothetical protein